MTAALQVDALSVVSSDATLLHPVSFELKPGEAMTLLGESGSGKSLLAQAILGALPSNLSATGTVVLQGDAVPAARPDRRRAWWGRRLALLPQEPWAALDPTMRIGAQLRETHRRVQRRSRADAAHAASDQLAALGLEGVDAKFPHMLSGGMAQRVAFAISRAGGAPVLIVDEPTKGLDTSLKTQLVDQLKQLLAAGGSVLTITHDVDVAQALGGRVAVMLDGRFVEQGSAAEVLGRPQHDYTRALLAAAPSAWARRDRPVDSTEPVLTARGIAKRFGAQRLFDGIDLDIARGDRLAIVGPSGSGKSTLGNILLGLVAPDAGRVERAPGVNATGLQKLYQDPGSAFAPRSTIRQSLEDLMRLHRLPRETIDALMQRLRLHDGLLDRLPRQLSGGELQRFAMVRVLALRPALVFADEPTSRLDPITQRESITLLLDASAEAGSALVLVTHDDGIARHAGGRTVMLR